MTVAVPTPALVLDRIAHSVLEGQTEKMTLAPLSRSFEPGRFHVVGGRSGSGKTTLLSILSLNIQATRGIILWGSQNLTALRPAGQAQWRRQHLGLVPQTSRLVGVMTAREHVHLVAAMHGMPEAEEEGLSILRALGMDAKLDHTPDKLSGGEKQRVALAQALCCRPSVLLADEPTATLDQINAELVAETLRRYARDRQAVVICVSHDRAVIDAADDLLTLAAP